jgi:hypothetical protein
MDLIHHLDDLTTGLVSVILSLGISITKFMIKIK